MTNAESGSDRLVDPAWIEANLEDPSVALIELDVSPAAYQEGHIPGAAFWSAYSDLRGPDYLPVERGELQRLLSRTGVSPETTVVFYGYGAALGFWLLKSHRHADVRMLEGRRERWSDAGGEWSTEGPGGQPGSYQLGDQDPEVFASRERVEEVLADSETVLLDVRSAAEFSGERFWPSGASADAGRAGRLPGAISVPVDLLREEDGSLRDPAELRRVFDERGVGPDRPLILYCTIGNRASQAWFALSQLLDYPDVSVYYASWVEWGKLDDTPIDSG